MWYKFTGLLDLLKTVKPSALQSLCLRIKTGEDKTLCKFMGNHKAGHILSIILPAKGSECVGSFSARSSSSSPSNILFQLMTNALI